jgi:predicted nicotinamide N-methyase
MRPADLPDSTRETVDCDTPARRATSTLVTLESDRAMDAYNHDVVEEVIPLYGRDLRLLRPRDAEALLDEHAFEHEEFLPYWAELWPSSLALAHAIGSRALKGARTLELGCGLGLPSIAAALAGGNVLATDWSTEAVAMTRANAERNEARLETLVCSWTSPEPLVDQAPWDLIIGSDLLYEQRNVDVLLDLLPRLGDDVLLADPGRRPAERFLAAARERWAIDSRTARELPNGALYRLRLQPVAT